MSGLLTVTSGAFREATGIHICTNHTAKMSGLWSLSISPRNHICEKRAKNKDSICSKCYSRAMQNTYSELEKCLSNNASIVTERILQPDELPKIGNKLKMFRFEAFGDIISAIQVTNYFHITEANPDVHCVLFTKNPWIIKNAMEYYHLEKPQNLTIIGSSYNLNEPMIDFYMKYDFIDYIFTVYDKAYIAANNININCGGRSCKGCKKCYLKSHTSYEINEELKGNYVSKTEKE